jgi:hypothetical protein
VWLVADCGDGIHIVELAEPGEKFIELAVWRERFRYHHGNLAVLLAENFRRLHGTCQWTGCDQVELVDHRLQTARCTFHPGTAGVRQWAEVVRLLGACELLLVFGDRVTDEDQFHAASLGRRECARLMGCGIHIEFRQLAQLRIPASREPPFEKPHSDPQFGLQV